MQPGDIAFKCNFATLDPVTGVVTSRRADRNFEDMGPIFCADLNGMLCAREATSCCSPSHKMCVGTQDTWYSVLMR